MENKKEDFRRIYTDRLFLTYTNTNLSKEDVLTFLLEKYQVKNYCICCESHYSEKKHIHVYVRFPKRLNIRNYRIFDIVDNHENKTYAHINRVKNVIDTLNYITKQDKEPLTNMPLELLEEGTKEFVSKPKTWLEQAYEIGLREGLEQGMEFLVLKDPNRTFKSYLSIKRNMESYLEDHRESRVKIDPLDSFVECEEIRNAKDWLLNRSNSKVLCLVGKTEVGKTSFAMSLLKDLNPLLVNNKESFQRFSPTKHKAIIFDDFKWDNLAVEERIHLLDLKNEYTVSIKFGSRLIPAGTIKLITCNDIETNGLKAYSVSKEETEPVLRRLEILKINKPLYKENLLVEENNQEELAPVEKRWTKSGVENQMLRGENERLKKENERLRKENEKLNEKINKDIRVNYFS